MGQATTHFEDIVHDVLLFMMIGQKDKVGVKIASHPSEHDISRRAKLIREEVVTETLGLMSTAYSGTLESRDGGCFEPNALSIEKQAELIDGCLDSIYVLIGALVEFGMHDQNTIWKCWREIQRSNMAKYIAIPFHFVIPSESLEVLIRDNLPEGRELWQVEVVISKTPIGSYIIYRDLNTQKILKPSSWTLPNIQAILEDSIQRRFALDNPDTLSTSLKSVGSGPYAV